MKRPATVLLAFFLISAMQSWNPAQLPARQGHPAGGSAFAQAAADADEPDDPAAALPGAHAVPLPEPRPEPPPADIEAARPEPEAPDPPEVGPESAGREDGGADEEQVPRDGDAGDTAQGGEEGESEPPVDYVPEPVSEAELADCEAELRELGATFERRETIDGEGFCGVAQPYRLTTAAPGVVVKPDTELSCAAALATARWVNGVVIPAAEALGEGVELAEIVHASTYVCRTRNSLSDTKVSEHARGNAIDVSSFDLDGHEPIPVVPRAGEGTIEEAFQSAVRKGACLYFTTVLGPGSDEYHADHLHMDVIERDSGYRLCQ